MTIPSEGASPFWRFSLDYYARPGVAEACLQLQDAACVDVNVLLFLIWRAMAGESLPVEAVRSIDGAVREWRRD